MKKISVLFVVLALMSVVCSAFASGYTVDTLPKIDADAAEDYLGVWYINEMCFADFCLSAADFGMSAELTLNEDNSFALVGLDEEEDEEEVLYWYIEDGKAVVVAEAENGLEEYANLTVEDEILSLVSLEEEGSLISFTRNEHVEWGTGEMKEDAEVADFLGDWYLYSMGDADMTLPVSMLGMEGVLTVREDGTLDVTMYDETDANVTFVLEDGKLVGEFTADEGEEPERFAMEYHVEDAVVVRVFPADESEMFMVFIREENLPEVDFSSLFDFDMTEEYSEDYNTYE